MSNEIKFSKEEMDTLNSIQEKYSEIQAELGQIQITKMRFAQQHKKMIDRESELSGIFENTQEEETKFVSSITEKYGDGTLDPKTGTYKLKK
tara:strand:- start:1251 stop:1526 length:276 start_codon:yes stop_codon:yes gene_type:complete